MANEKTRPTVICHSSIGLTMNVYTDPKLLDVAGAVEALPALPLNGKDAADEFAKKATGTDGNPTDGSPHYRPSQFTPKFAPTSDKSATPQSLLTIPDKPDTAAKKRGNPRFSGEKQGFSGLSDQWAIKDSNLRHPPCKGGALTN